MKSRVEGRVRARVRVRGRGRVKVRIRGMGRGRVKLRRLLVVIDARDEIAKRPD